MIDSPCSLGYATSPTDIHKCAIPNTRLCSLYHSPATMRRTAVPINAPTCTPLPTADPVAGVIAPVDPVGEGEPVDVELAVWPGNSIRGRTNPMSTQVV